MSTISGVEKRKFERLFDMDSGYVLNFSNRTFQEFVLDEVAIDIYDDKYDYASGSKANRLRAFWTREPDHVTAKLLSSMVEYAEDLGCDAKLASSCREVVDRLSKSAPVADLDAITPNADGRDFEVLALSIWKSIDDNEPAAGLDRLHTFMVKYVRVLCEERSIDTSRSKPLHSLFGELLKALTQEGLIESQMSERILKSSISILDSFN